jgi:hypothetical protein
MARVPLLLRGGVNAVALILLIGTIVISIGWLIRQGQRLILREPLNIPKYLLLAAAIPMHWIVLVTPMPAKPIALVAILTVYHNLQYQRLIWFHNKKYVAGSHGHAITDRLEPGIVAAGGASAVAKRLNEKYGPAELISRRLVYYLAFGILFGLLYQAPRQILGYFGLKASHGVPTAVLPIQIQLGVAFLWGVAFIHYYLDSKIWRVRRDPSVGQALKMS